MSVTGLPDFGNKGFLQDGMTYDVVETEHDHFRSPYLDSAGRVGRITVFDFMGNDWSPILSARKSTNRSAPRGVEKSKSKVDERGGNLIHRLMRDEHLSPFEMAQLQVTIYCPMFVARQWFRHRTGSFNEFSLRYSELPVFAKRFGSTVEDEQGFDPVLELDGDTSSVSANMGNTYPFYIPTSKSICYQSKINKQGSDGQVSPMHAYAFQDALVESCQACIKAYRSAIGLYISRETARIVLPVNIYTEFVWSTNLRNLMHFVKLRAHKDAQKEISMFAYKLSKIMATWVPVSYDAFLSTIWNNIEDYNVYLS